MYALFKVANGEDITKAPAPGMFDLKVSSPFFVSSSLTHYFQGKAKQKAWQKEVDAKTSGPDAEARYVKLVGELKEKYGYDPSKEPEPLSKNA
jgi:diazepam-binding inhibitor (GABA receptor modulator, acyl-CoA-binding protein)